MKQERIRRNLYKVLRKTGVPRDLIIEDAALQEELLKDDLDLTCFLFFLETKFEVEIENSELAKLYSVGSTIEFLQKHCA
ncbi:acyl carrier protein [Saccharicrinis carchari]|uniref:Acyl carrier protein n=1 Tax=Saccharicrinis carchari TaxID=1168039 RepID=A0A521DIY1_SACCC|nr:acyl carrier protein [Saccharicrinis carchari]SMO71552.1 acyl carrier protein [Saccharicrinis carchari]